MLLLLLAQAQAGRPLGRPAPKTYLMCALSSPALTLASRAYPVTWPTTDGRRRANRLVERAARVDSPRPMRTLLLRLSRKQLPLLPLLRGAGKASLFRPSAPL